MFRWRDEGEVRKKWKKSNSYVFFFFYFKKKIEQRSRTKMNRSQLLFGMIMKRNHMRHEKT